MSGKTNNKVKHTQSFEKLKELDEYFDTRLRLLKNLDIRQPAKNQKHQAFIKKWVARLCLFALLIILPFFVLIRISIYLYSAYQLNGWLALTGGVLATVFLLLMYVWTVNYHMMKKQRFNRYLVHGIALLVLAYCCYGLLYFSGMNVKNQEVRSYYHALHPILRITLATTTLADQRLIITDTRRIPDDYHAMGLPVNEQSLHYVQQSGYVHAVDIRTKGRAGWKNWFTQNMFRLAGLKTLRHIGTEDHLHVFLPLND